jgi:hypothetical protein
MAVAPVGSGLRVVVRCAGVAARPYERNRYAIDRSKNAITMRSIGEIVGFAGYLRSTCAAGRLPAADRAFAGPPWACLKSAEHGRDAPKWSQRTCLVEVCGTREAVDGASITLLTSA